MLIEFLLSSVLEFIKDIARYEPLDSPAREVAVVGELLQEVQRMDHICRQLHALATPETHVNGF